MIESFYLTPENRDLILDICDELGIKSNEGLVAVCRAMTKIGRLSSTVTPKTKAEYVEHLARHYKILKVEPKHAD